MIIANRLPGEPHQQFLHEDGAVLAPIGGSGRVIRKSREPHTIRDAEEQGRHAFGARQRSRPAVCNGQPAAFSTR